MWWCGLGATCRMTHRWSPSRIIEKIETSKGRVRRTQARIVARQAAGQDARDDEKWLAVELDFLNILEGRLKELKG